MKDGERALFELAAELRSLGDQHDMRRHYLDPPASTIAHAVASAYYDAAAKADLARSKLS